MRTPVRQVAVFSVAVACTLGAAGSATAATQIVPTTTTSEINAYRIDEPNVKTASTLYPTIRIRGGDRVAISAGGCVQTGGRGKTWKRYVDPSGPNANRLYHGLVAIPGRRLTRISALIGSVMVVPVGTTPGSLTLGYEDDGYGDNGYASHDDGTDDQCKGVRNAWVVIVIEHPAAAAAPLPLIPALPGLNGSPILTTDYRSPAHDTSAPDWAGNICYKKRWLANATPRYEWTNVYGRDTQYDDDAAGLSGLAVFSDDVLQHAGLSGADVQFTHPFGGDWETFVAPDPAFVALLAPSNTGVAVGATTPTGEYADTMARAKTLGLSVPNGVMGMEMDRDLIPPIYRAADGDRLALFGRWIVDCGHEDFHTEIHPPLLFVRARAISAGSSPDITAQGAPAITYSRAIARPFLTSQEFGDGALRTHLEKEAAKAITGIGPIGLSNRIEAHPNLFTKPFSAIHLFSYVVRAPVLPPAGVAGAPPQLVCTFHFTTRTGVAVQVIKQSSDSVRVIVAMNATSSIAARTPVRRDLNVTFSELKKQEPDAAEDINLTLAGAAATRGVFDALIARGILTDRYDAPIAASPTDGIIVSVPVDNLASARQFSVDDGQPFPLYGWLTLKWRRTRAVQLPPHLPVPVHTSVPVHNPSATHRPPG